MTLHQFAIGAGTILASLVVVAFCELYDLHRRQRGRDAHADQDPVWADDDRCD